MSENKPVADGAREDRARELAKKLTIAYCTNTKTVGESIDAAAALITQALREEREKLFDALKHEATWSMAQDGTHALWFTEASLKAAILGEKGE